MCGSAPDASGYGGLGGQTGAGGWGGQPGRAQGSLYGPMGGWRQWGQGQQASNAPAPGAPIPAGTGATTPTAAFPVATAPTAGQTPPMAPTPTIAASGPVTGAVIPGAAAQGEVSAGTQGGLASGPRPAGQVWGSAPASAGDYGQNQSIINALRGGLAATGSYGGNPAAAQGGWR